MREVGLCDSVDGHRVDLGRDLWWSERERWVAGLVLYLSALLPVVGWVAVALGIGAAYGMRLLRHLPHSVVIRAHGLTLAHGASPRAARYVPFAELSTVTVRGSGFDLVYADGNSAFVPCRRDEATLERTVAHIRDRLQRFRQAEATAPSADAADHRRIRVLLLDAALKGR